MSRDGYLPPGCTEEDVERAAPQNQPEPEEEPLPKLPDDLTVAAVLGVYAEDNAGLASRAAQQKVRGLRNAIAAPHPLLEVQDVTNALGCTTGLIDRVRQGLA